MEIPFLGGAYEGRSKSINAQQSINLFPVLDQQEGKTVIAMYNTPGLVEFCDTGEAAVVRGMHVMGDSLYAVVGSAVHMIDSDGNSIDLGDITTSTGHVGMASNGTQLLIVDGTTNGHIVSEDSLSDITAEGFPKATDCIFFDGYFIVTVYGSGKIQISGLYNGMSWDPLDFATAEASPDGLVGINSTHQNIWLFGETTVEIYYNSGNPDFPFERVPGAILDVGCASVTSVAEIKGVLHWLTNKKMVVRSTGHSFETVSPPSINYQISTYTDVTDSVGYVYSLEGRTFYVLSFPTGGRTWVYDADTHFWHEWSSIVT